MDEGSGRLPSNLLEAIQARLVEEAKAKIARDMSEIERLASAYPDAVKAIASGLGLVEPSPEAAAREPEISPSRLEVLRDLIDQYRSSPSSPLHGLKHITREHYEALMKLIEGDYADHKLSEIDAGTLDTWYAKWREGGRIAISHSKMVMLRTLFGFGTTLVRDENCARLFGLLDKMKLELPKVRTEHLTRDQANRIRAKAHEKKRHSIALAQAFQSDTGYSQKDIVGEWVPMSEPGISDVIHEGMKWLRGVRWEEIDENLTLSHFTGDKLLICKLKDAPMVMEELERIRAKSGGVLPAKGPIVVSEYDKLPWSAVEFRRWWRLLANECGIPKTVRNSDSRVKGHNAERGNVKVSETSSGGRFD